MTPSKALFWCCLSFIGGVFLSSFVIAPPWIWWSVLVMAVGFVAGYFFKRTLMVMGLCLFFFVMGAARLEVADWNMLRDPLRLMNDTNKTIALTGQIVREPDVRPTSQKFVVMIESSRVLVTTDRFADYRYLDTVRITGKLKPPLETETFSYKNYLAKDGIYSVMDYPVVTLVSSEHRYAITSYLYEKLLALKAMLVLSIDRQFSPPDSFILRGMVFGDDKSMPQDLKAKFAVTGLSHVTAVSGTNIVILANVVMVFLLALGCWRGQAFYLAVAFIWTYVVLIGFPASGVRAAIMGSMVLLAEKAGRQNASPRMLVLAAAVMLFGNPLLLVYDIGFQLSFLASLGIVYLKPLLDDAAEKWLFLKSPEAAGNRRGGGVIRFFVDIISVTLAAQIITLPIIAYNFGTVSLIAPVTNLLALPPVTVLTIAGIMVSVIGTFSGTLAFFVSVPCWFLLRYFVWVLDTFSTPWATVTVANVPWWWPVVGYGLLGATMIWLWRRRRSAW